MKRLVVIIVFIILGTISAGYIFGQDNPRISPDPATQNTPVNTPGTKQLQFGTLQRLRIPRIGVDAGVESVGLDKAGKMDVPAKAENVAWYNLGGKLGEKGNAVIAGHYDRVNGEPAVFWNLKNLEIGDEIRVIDNQDNELTYKITSKAVYNFDQFPLQEVFGVSNIARLNLITCEGVYNSSAKNYSQRTVVYSELQNTGLAF